MTSMFIDAASKRVATVSTEILDTTSLNATPR
jgi:hypothetical protein